MLVYRQRERDIVRCVGVRALSCCLLAHLFSVSEVSEVSSVVDGLHGVHRVSGFDRDKRPAVEYLGLLLPQRH